MQSYEAGKPTREESREYIFDMVRELADLALRNGEPAVAILLEAMIAALLAERRAKRAA